MADKKQYSKDYYNKNKERLRQQALKYYYKNSDDINNSRRGTQSDYMKQYYQDNKNYFIERNKNEDVKALQRISSLKHYYNNREKINEKRKQKYHETKPPPTIRPKYNKIKKTKPKPKPKPKRYVAPPTQHIFTDDGKILLRF